MKHRITLVPQGGYWVAVHSDPAIYELFGTLNIPTGWADTVDGFWVTSQIANLNPDLDVRMTK